MSAIDLAFFFFLGTALFKVVTDYIAHERQMTAEANSRRTAQVRRVNVPAETIRSINKTAGAKKAVRTSLRPTSPAPRTASATKSAKVSGTVKTVI